MENTFNNSTMGMEHTSRPLHHSLMLWTGCFIAVIAFLEHFAILLLTIINKTLRQKPYIVSILLLSSSDMLLSIAMLVFSLINLLELRQTWVCGLQHFLIQVGFVSSLLQTLNICTERYLNTKPMPMEPFSPRKRLLLTLIIMLTSSALLGIPFLFVVRESTINACLLVSIYGDNLDSALVLIRLVTFLIWLSTLIIYTKTAKNFRNAIRRAGHFANQNIRLPKVIQIQVNNLPSHDDSLPSCWSNEGGSSTGVNEQLNLDSKTVYAATKTLHSVSERKIKNNDINTDRAAKVHLMIKPQDARHQQKNKDDANIMCEEGTPPVRWDSSRSTSDVSTTRTSDTLNRNKQSDSSAKREAFRIVSIVFVVFLVSMTPQSVVGFVMIFCTLPETVVFGCKILAVSSVITNPFMYAFLLKDFRNVLRCK